MKLSIARWHEGRFEPEEDGVYLAITKFSETAKTLYFTVEGGWNTYIKETVDGVGIPDEIRTEEDRKEWCEYVQYWAELPVLGGLINV